ncbi:hypothetical protein BESB_070540 [Besnoitia besnoiti]|uniref:Zinc finger, C3HC4 type (RING finger) domain-containing protein n=1 Tax=Besnoitia besnoiti TaxID=94643 RepID=A0A2A9MET7_BESBE|nr:uncharacterized protein BESB_070540 [Besnoitia besnoiti]PFH33902.1 hypothetical protein BESB_070540 [Besnoitia besnoiti]
MEDQSPAAVQLQASQWGADAASPSATSLASDTPRLFPASFSSSSQASASSLGYSPFSSSSSLASLASAPFSQPSPGGSALALHASAPLSFSALAASSATSPFPFAAASRVSLPGAAAPPAPSRSAPLVETRVRVEAPPSPPGPRDWLGAAAPRARQPPFWVPAGEASPAASRDGARRSRDEARRRRERDGGRAERAESPPPVAAAEPRVPASRGAAALPEADRRLVVPLPSYVFAAGGEAAKTAKEEPEPRSRARGARACGGDDSLNAPHECPICTESFGCDEMHRPKVLTCGHTMCFSCILRILPNSRGLSVMELHQQVVARSSSTSAPLPAPPSPASPFSAPSASPLAPALAASVDPPAPSQFLGLFSAPPPVSPAPREAAPPQGARGAAWHALSQPHFQFPSFAAPLAPSTADESGSRCLDAAAVMASRLRSGGLFGAEALYLHMRSLVHRCFFLCPWCRRRSRIAADNLALLPADNEVAHGDAGGEGDADEAEARPNGGAEDKQGKDMVAEDASSSGRRGERATAPRRVKRPLSPEAASRDGTRDSLKTFCSAHPRQEVVAYCRPCMSLVCALCIAGEDAPHYRHARTSLTGAVEAVAKNARATLWRLHQLEEELRAAAQARPREEQMIEEGFRRAFQRGVRRVEELRSHLELYVTCAATGLADALSAARAERLELHREQRSQEERLARAAGAAAAGLKAHLDRLASPAPPSSSASGRGEARSGDHETTCGGDPGGSDNAGSSPPGPAAKRLHQGRGEASAPSCAVLLPSGALSESARVTVSSPLPSVTCPARASSPPLASAAAPSPAPSLADATSAPRPSAARVSSASSLASPLSPLSLLSLSSSLSPPAPLAGRASAHVALLAALLPALRYAAATQQFVERQSGEGRAREEARARQVEARCATALRGKLDSLSHVGAGLAVLWRTARGQGFARDGDTDRGEGGGRESGAGAACSRGAGKAAAVQTTAEGAGDAETVEGEADGESRGQKRRGGLQDREDQRAGGAEEGDVRPPEVRGDGGKRGRRRRDDEAGLEEETPHACVRHVVARERVRTAEQGRQGARRDHARKDRIRCRIPHDICLSGDICLPLVELVYRELPCDPLEARASRAASAAPLPHPPSPHPLSSSLASSPSLAVCSSGSPVSSGSPASTLSSPFTSPAGFLARASSSAVAPFPSAASSPLSSLPHLPSPGAAPLSRPLPLATSPASPSLARQSVPVATAAPFSSASPPCASLRPASCPLPSVSSSLPGSPPALASSFPFSSVSALPASTSRAAAWSCAPSSSAIPGSSYRPFSPSLPPSLSQPFSLGAAPSHCLSGSLHAAPRAREEEEGKREEEEERRAARDVREAEAASEAPRHEVAFPASQPPE